MTTPADAAGGELGEDVLDPGVVGVSGRRHAVASSAGPDSLRAQSLMLNGGLAMTKSAPLRPVSWGADRGRRCRPSGRRGWR